MPAPLNERMTVNMEGDFVVFIICLKIYNFVKVDKWLGVVLSMPKMLKELAQKPESGYLGSESSFSIIVQYWRSFEQLEAYARDRNGLHYPAWRDFNTKVKKSGVVGIWHETYQVRAGEYECIYHNMPPFGLGKVGKLVPATGKLEMAGGRIKPKTDS
jgi:hypothetical protein